MRTSSNANASPIHTQQLHNTKVKDGHGNLGVVEEEEKQVHSTMRLHRCLTCAGLMKPYKASGVKIAIRCLCGHPLSRSEDSRPRPSSNWPPSNVSWVCHGWICLIYLPSETSGGERGQMPKPPRLTPLGVEKQHLYSDLFLQRTFSRSYSQCYSHSQ